MGGILTGATDAGAVSPCWGIMADGVCPKCGWKAPEGLLKCPFCKTYIRTPGSSSSDIKLKRPISSREPAPTPPPDPSLPPADPTVVKEVQRALARELFDDSDKWQVFEQDPPTGIAEEESTPDEDTEPPVR